MLDQPDAKETTTNSRVDAAFVTLQNALRKAAPVVKTAVGGALAIGSAVVLKDLVVPHWNQFNDVPANAAMIKGLLGSIGVVDTAIGLGGVKMMQKPVGEAVNFFRAKLSPQRVTK